MMCSPSPLSGVLGLFFALLQGPAGPAGWATSVHVDGWSVAHPAGFTLGEAEFFGVTTTALVPPEDDGTPIFLVFTARTDTTWDDAGASLRKFGSGPLVRDESTAGTIDVVLDIGGGAHVAEVFLWNESDLAGAWTVYDPATEDAEAGRAVLRRIVASMVGLDPPPRRPPVSAPRRP